MEDRSLERTPLERPPDAAAAGSRAALGPPHLGDPRALTILTTEHWSLLTARSLVYNEAFSRAGMFLTFLSATVVALGFVSQGSGFRQEFYAVATALLGFDLLIGLTTLGRIQAAATEEFRALQGMNRIRHAYLEMVPTLEPYFSTSQYDDLVGVLSVYGATTRRPSPGEDFLHGLTTTPGMMGMVIAVVGGAFGASLTLLLGMAPMTGFGTAVVAFVGFFVAIWFLQLRLYQATNDRLDVRFPSPPEP